MARTFTAAEARAMREANAPAMHTDPLILAWIELDAAAAEVHRITEAAGVGLNTPEAHSFASRRLRAQLRKPDDRLARAIANFGAEHDAALGR